MHLSQQCGTLTSIAALAPADAIRAADTSLRHVKCPHTKRDDSLPTSTRDFYDFAFELAKRAKTAFDSFCFGVYTFLRLCKMLRLTAVAAFLASASAFAPAAVPSRAVSKTGESYFCASIGSFRSLGCPRDCSANSRRGGVDRHSAAFVAGG